MNKRDLRVIKTNESIEAALLELLKSKPVEKISVVELCRVANINKSTFYLHFQDIHDLFRQLLLKTVETPFQGENFFDDLFFDPERFFMRLGDEMAANFPAVFTFTHTYEDFSLIRDVVTILSQKTYETGLLEKNLENDLKLETVYSAMMFVMPKHHFDCRELGQAQLVSVVRALFPGMERKKE